MTDIHAVIAELKALNDGPTPYAWWPADGVERLLAYIDRLEAVVELARRCHNEMPLNDGTCELIYDLGDRLDELDGKEAYSD